MSNVAQSGQAARVATAGSGDRETLDKARRLFPDNTLQHLDADSAARCQALIGHGESLGIWETPDSLVGRRQFPNRRSTNLRQRLTVYLPADLQPSASLTVLLDEAVLQMTRFALVQRLLPAGLGANKGRSLDCTTIRSNLEQYLPKIFAKCIERGLENPDRDAPGLIQYLTPDDVIDLRGGENARAELNRMQMLTDMGLWHDAPPTPRINQVTSPKGKKAEAKPEREHSPHPPIPDDYLVEMGPRVLWLVQDLGPNLVHLFEAIPDLFRNIQFGPDGKDSNGMQRQLRHYFGHNTWRDKKGHPISAPPFPLRIGTGRGSAFCPTKIDLHPWPPHYWEHLQTLAVSLQSAHLWIAFLAMGGRVSEVSSLKRDCVEWARDGKAYADGKTYKLSACLSGTEHKWPAPEVLVQALAQQVQLVSAWEQIARVVKGVESVDGVPLTVERDHLWASLGTANKTDPEAELAGFSGALKKLAERMGLSSTPGGKALHPKRFRKTIARLAGIAIVDSPRVLMKLLGHKDIQMTLHYILTDKALQVEIDKVARELRIMRCHELIEDIHTALHTPGAPQYGGHGGGGAPVLAETVKKHEEELNRTGRLWDAESSYELSVILTGNGQYFRVTRPGVLCLKEAKLAGPCTCDSSCLNRIEEKTARRDIREVIPILIAEGKRALAENQLLLVADKVQQLDEDLARFEDIKAEFGGHPDLITLREAVA